MQKDQEIKELCVRLQLDSAKLLDQTQCFRYGVDLATAEFASADSERVSAGKERRSFCFHHGTRTAKAILLIHGFTSSPFEMLEMGTMLFEAGYNVFGVRLKGHGTDIVDFSNSEAPDWYRSAEKGLAITTALGEEIVVIGESMGGALTSILAARYPQIISKIVLCAPCMKIKSPFARFTRSKIVRFFLPVVKIPIPYPCVYWYDRTPTKQVNELAKLASTAAAAAPLILARTLIIQAQNDAMVNWRANERFYQQMERASEKELKILPYGHHNLTLDVNPLKDAMFEWIKEFVATK